jgi:hypothetical protein
MRPNANRAKLAITFIWIVLGLQIVTTISNYFLCLLYKGVAEGELITPEIANATNFRQGIILIFYSILFILSIVFFIRWFRRAYYNQEIKFNSMATSNGWASGAWFVPIINLFKPYQMMHEMYLNAENYLLEKRLIEAKKSRKQMIGWWWGFWIGSIVIDRFLNIYGVNATEINELINATLFSVGAGIIFIPLSIFTARTIQNYNEMELILEQEREDVMYFKSNGELLDSDI